VRTAKFPWVKSCEAMTSETRLPPDRWRAKSTADTLIELPPLSSICLSIPTIAYHTVLPPTSWPSQSVTESNALSHPKVSSPARRHGHHRRDSSACHAVLLFQPILNGSLSFNFAVPNDTLLMTCGHTENLLLGKKSSF